MKVLVIDTETGGLNPDKHSILSIAAVAGDLETGQKIEKFYSLVKLPNYEVSTKAMSINKLDLEECKKTGKTPEQIGQELMDMWLRNNCTVLAGHNVTFDKLMISKQIYNVSLSEFESNFGYHVIDSMTIGLLFAGIDVKSGNTLKQLCEAWNIKPKSTSYHNALFDTEICFDVIYKFRNSIFNNTNIISEIQK